MFDDDPAPPRRPAQAQPRRSRALLLTAAVVIAAFFLLSAFTGVWTDKLWFSSVGYGDVFAKTLGTRVLLFVVFGALLGGVVAATRAGSTYCALRLRSHDEDRQVLEGPDLVPALLQLLQATLAPDPGPTQATDSADEE